MLLLQRFHRQLFCLNKRISNSLPQQRVSNRDWNLSPYFHIVLICQGVFNVIAGSSSKTHKTIRVQCVPDINMQRGEKPKQVDFSSFPWASTKNTNNVTAFTYQITYQNSGQLVVLHCARIMSFLTSKECVLERRNSLFSIFTCLSDFLRLAAKDCNGFLLNFIEVVKISVKAAYGEQKQHLWLYLCIQPEKL